MTLYRLRETRKTKTKAQRNSPGKKKKIFYGTLIHKELNNVKDFNHYFSHVMKLVMCSKERTQLLLLFMDQLMVEVGHCK
jgi:hypothetical protein